MEHLKDYPVSRSTYMNHACRCDGCRAAWRTYIKAQREAHPNKHREHRRRLVLAAQWMKRYHLAEWDRLCEQAAIDVAEGNLRT